MIDLNGQTVIITGGSRGIGRASALLFAEAGARVAIGYHSDGEAAEAVIREIERRGGRALAVAGDASSRPDFERLWQEAESELGPVDCVVINAGIWKRASIDQMTDQQLNETLDVNLRSAFNACRVAAVAMKARRKGSIILVSSTAGQRGEPHYSHYAATKGGMIALTKSLAAELGPFNIRVNSVAPGWVLTDMTESVFSDQEFRHKVERITPLGRIAEARDIAAPILFLASDLARHIQGEILNVNGGSVLCG